jgi:CDP-diacylglycerol--glycerol-3-phosphate 3-phosphatidyltransferase
VGYIHPVQETAADRPKAFIAEGPPRRRIRVANLLTLSRIALAPVFVWAFLQGHVAGHAAWAQCTALAVALSFELTDAFDGWVARRRNEVSDFGKILDPLADSISRFTVFLCFLLAGYADIWSVAIIFWRDAVIATLRIVSAGQHVVLAARTWGKGKAVVQAVAILSILVFGLVPMFPPGGVGGWFLWRVEDAEHYQTTALWIMRGVAGVTAVSLVDYLRGNREVLRKLDI